MLRARAPSHGPWEDFTLCKYSTYYTLRSNANHLYVSAEVGYTGIFSGLLRARNGTVGPWEMFSKDSFDQPGFWLLSQQNHDFVTSELGYPANDGKYGMLRARTVAPSTWEYFDS